MGCEFTISSHKSFPTILPHSFKMVRNTGFSPLPIVCPLNETTEGNQYIEKLSCGSSWDISMKNINNIATREIGITEINVEEKPF